MSFNREGVVWESTPGKWRYGLFDTFWVGSEADGHDPEWDMEYDYSKFWWTSSEMSTPNQAFLRYPGPNPGSHWTVERGGPNEPEAITMYNRMHDAVDIDFRGR